MVSCSGSLAPSRYGVGLALLSPLRCSGSRLFYMERALRCARFQPSGVPQKHGLGCACIPCLPRLSGSGSQELDGRTRVRCAFSLPRPQPQFPPALVGCVCIEFSRDPPGGCRPSRISGSLVRNWRPVCSVVGDAVFGAEFALSSPLCLLPQAGLGQSAAG